MASTSNLLRRCTLAVWRAMPQDLRRRAAHALITAVSLRPKRQALPARGRRDLLDEACPDGVNARGPWIVAGYLSSPSGVGQSARLAVRALQAAGLEVAGIDLSSYFYEGSGEIDVALPDGRALLGPANLLLVVNAPYVPYALWLIGARAVRDKFIIGYWAWEQSSLPNSWRRGTANVHAVAVPSTFTAQAVRLIAPDLPVAVIPHPVVLDFVPAPVRGAPSRPGTQPFTVLGAMNIASGYERKNPVGLIAAFRRAFGDRADCRLRLLVTNAEHYAPAREAIENAVGGAANIEIHWESMPRADFVQWWGQPDVVASLHRSEGFGLVLAEGMLAGCAVMATGWSGNMEFMGAQTAFPLRYTLVDVDDPQGKYATAQGQWAEPDLDHAVEVRRRLESDPQLRYEVGERARAAIHTSLAGQAFVDRLQTLTSSTLPV